MEVNGSTHTQHSPRTNLSGEVFQTLSRVQKVKNDLRAGEDQEQTNQKVEPKREPPPLEELQKMVLSPSKVPLEERLSQVISLEDIQRLLLLRGPVGSGEKSMLTGHLVDRRA